MTILQSGTQTTNWFDCNVSTGDIFPDVDFEIFPQFLQQSDESLPLELPSFVDDKQETQPTMTTALLMPSQVPQTETLIKCNGNILLQMKIFPSQHHLDWKNPIFSCAERRNNRDKRVSCKQKHKVTHTNMAGSMYEHS